MKHPVLLVDDDEALLGTLARVLARCYEIHTARSYDEALTTLHRHSVDAVVEARIPLSDMSYTVIWPLMPRYSGAETGGRFRSGSREFHTSGGCNAKRILDSTGIGNRRRSSDGVWWRRRGRLEQYRREERFGWDRRERR